MLNDFQKYIAQNHLFEPEHKLLVAVSGGADSVVLLHLLLLSHYNISIAHCNFKLRGAESDEDEEFVKQLANQYHVPFYSIKFDTLEYVKVKKISIEMAARELRYDWFNELVKKHNIPFIVTGHHLNDSIETMFLNLCRGTGINGLKGIAPLNGNIARPLLFATRERIESYARLNNLTYRIDSTNLSDNYLRNIVRQTVIPGLKKVNPDFEERMRDNFDQINQAANIYNSQIAGYKNTLLKEENKRKILDLEGIVNSPFAKTILYELIQPFGFNNSQVNSILSYEVQNSGQLFFSPTHKLLIDRKKLIIEKQKTEDQEILTIDYPHDVFVGEYNLKMKVVPIENFALDRRVNVACIDYQTLKFPVEIRRWQPGDTFYPLGMENPKKISDFFIDNKVDRFTKDVSYVLVSNNQIVWVMNHRIDNRFRITANTQAVLIIESVKA